VLYDDHEHVSIASLPGMYERAIPVYTFSKTYAITGLRLGYIAVKNDALRDRLRKLLFYTVSNTSSLIQYGGVGALEGSQAFVEEFQRELAARRDLFYRGLADAAPGILTGDPPAGAFYAFVHVNRDWRSPLPDASPFLTVVGDGRATFIKCGRIGCCAGRRFRSRRRRLREVLLCEGTCGLTGALESMAKILR
jgi:aspartate/methionine/tyrosine aminotransferase